MWLVTDSRGTILDAHLGAQSKIAMEGLQLAAIFGEAAARELDPQGNGRCTVPFLLEDEAHRTEWRVERHVLQDGRMLILGRALGREYATLPMVPTAWERRFTRKLDPEQGDIVEQQRTFMLSIFDADPSLIFVKDRFGRFIFLNQATADLFGKSAEDVVRQYLDAIHDKEDELKTFDEVDQRVLATLSEVSLDEPFTLANGMVRWFHTRKRPLRAPSGEVFVLGISVDVTERKRVEQLLHHTNQRLELAASAGELGLWDWNIQTGDIYFSPGWKAQIGHTDEELPNTFETWEQRMHPEDRERVLKTVNDHVQEPSRGDRYVNEFRLRTKDGSWKWIAGYGLVVRDSQGKAVRVTGHHVDIHARKHREEEEQELRDGLRRANERLERISQMKDEFLANMSHELRTPLNAVLGQAEALRDGIFGPVSASQTSALDMVEESSRHLLSLINDILDVARGNAGHLVLEPGIVPVDDLCQESIRQIREQARRKSISVAFASDGTVTTVMADRRRLRQILLNLLSNAKKFTADGGRIGLDVGSRKDGQEVVFSVWDTGCGISKEDLQRLFEPFVQLDAGLARKHEGSGLGLALVRRLVELHHGSISIESEVGRGSRFTVVLPTEQPGMPTGRESASSRASTPARPPTERPPNMVRSVVVADDNETNTSYLRDYLGAKGFEVHVARNGLQAIELCLKVKPSVVLMDIQMPELDGLQAIRRLRAEPSTSGLAIVALTALAMPGDRERCLEAGADEYLSKPVRLKTLVDLVETLATRSALDASAADLVVD